MNKNFILFITTLSYLTDSINASCRDYRNSKVNDGEHFFPTNDMCTKCTCYQNSTTDCEVEHCELPECQNVGNLCCDFTCVIVNRNPMATWDGGVTHEYTAEQLAEARKLCLWRRFVAKVQNMVFGLDQPY